MYILTCLAMTYVYVTFVEYQGHSYVLQHQNSMKYFLSSVFLHIRDVSECSRTRSRKCWLNIFKFGCHLLQNSLLGTIYSNPICLLMSPGPRSWICWCDTDTVLHCVMFARFSMHHMSWALSLLVLTCGLHCTILIIFFSASPFCHTGSSAADNTGRNEPLYHIRSWVVLNTSWSGILSFGSRCQYSSTAAFTLLLQKLYKTLI
jgi:hypothetical protein